MTRSMESLLIHSGRAPKRGSDWVLVSVDELLIGASVPARQWAQLEVDLADIGYARGVASALDGMGTTRTIRWRVSGSVPVTLLNVPSTLVDGRNVIASERQQSMVETILRVRLGWHTQLSILAGACLPRAVRPARAMFGRDRVLIDGSAAERFAALDPLVAVFHDSDSENIDSENPGPLPVGDVLLGAAAVGENVAWRATSVDSSVPRSWAAARSALSGTGPMKMSLDPIDIRVVNPIGFKGGSLGERATLLWDPGSDRRHFQVAGKTVCSGGRKLGLAVIQKLREVSYVEETPLDHPSPRDRAQFLAECAAAGIVTVSRGMDPLTRGLLPAELAELLEARDASSLLSREGREASAIAGVRISHLALSHRVLLAKLMGLGPSDASVSVVLASRRPEFIGHALDQVGAQTLPNVEVLVGLHGFGAESVSKEVRNYARGRGVSFFEYAEDVVFGDVLQDLTLRAQGDYVAKMDDDDWYGTNHLQDLVLSHDYSGATLVGSGVQFVYMNGPDITIRRSIDQAFRYGGHPGGPTILMRRDDLLAVGGWPRVRRAVDTGLNDRVVRSGGVVYQGAPLNFMFNRRSSGHTWKASSEYFIGSARAVRPGLVPPIGFGREVSPADFGTPNRVPSSGFVRRDIRGSGPRRGLEWMRVGSD